MQLKLVAGALVGETAYDHVYSGVSDADGVSKETGAASLQPLAPTLAGAARKVASCGGPQLDEKQYILYEVICCTFLLGLVQNGMDTSPSFRHTLRGVFAGYKDAA